jgi:hypothetical protein
MQPPSEATSSVAKPVAVADILGCWKLIHAVELIDGVERPNPNLGTRPTGYLHYLAEGRVAVVVSLDGRKLLSGDHRRTAPREELADAALTFDAYAGTFSLIAPDRIAHHIEISTYQNDVGKDLVRRIVLEGDRLTLYPVEYAQMNRWLVWQRVPSASP